MVHQISRYYKKQTINKYLLTWLKSLCAELVLRTQISKEKEPYLAFVIYPLFKIKIRKNHWFEQIL